MNFNRTQQQFKNEFIQVIVIYLDNFLKQVGRLKYDDNYLNIDIIFIFKCRHVNNIKIVIDSNQNYLKKCIKNNTYSKYAQSQM